MRQGSALGQQSILCEATCPYLFASSYGPFPAHLEKGWIIIKPIKVPQQQPLGIYLHVE